MPQEAARERGDGASRRLLVEQARTVAEWCAGNAAAIDREDGFPEQEFALIAAGGLLAAPLGLDRGGLGLSGLCGAERTLALLVLLRQLGWGNLAVGRLYEGHVNALQLIELFGTPAQSSTSAADARDGHKRFAVWNTEATDGVRIVPMAGERYRLEGAKTFASGAGYVDRGLVTGDLCGRGWQICVVPMDQVQVSIDRSWWRTSGMRASASYRVDFSGVEIDATALLGAPGDYYREPYFHGGAVRFAAVQLGGAAALLDATRSYLRTVGRTADPYQEARVGEMAIAVESGNLWLRGAAAVADRGDAGMAGDVAYANMMRTAIETICLDVIRLAERCVGARGLLASHPLERIIRDLTLYLRQPAPDAALAAAGRYLLDREEGSADLWAHD